MVRVESQTASNPLLSHEPDAIESWLSVFARLMHLPDGRKQAICAELHEHLRERVRDLMLGGKSEPQSIQQAIEELGETAHLAQRFETANRTKQRRLFMNFTIIGVSAGALAVGIVATQSNHRAPSVFESKTADKNIVTTDAKLAIASDATLGSIIDSIPEQTSLGLSVDWCVLEPLGFTKDSPWGLSGKNLPVQRALELIAERPMPSGDRFDWRFDGQTLIISTSRTFDAKESVLACYPIHDAIGPIIAVGGCSHDDAADQIRGVIQSLVEPENWRDNGGDLAAMHIVGDRMFIQAPPRMHQRVEWILLQLNEGKAVEEGGQSKAKDVPFHKELPVVGQEKPAKSSLVPPAILGPGDVVNVEVWELIVQGEWYKATRTVDSEGQIRLPVVGDIGAGGHRPKDVEVNLVEKLKTQEILTKPIVAVYVAPANAGVATAEPAIGAAGATVK